MFGCWFWRLLLCRFVLAVSLFSVDFALWGVFSWWLVSCWGRVVSGVRFGWV